MGSGLPTTPAPTLFQWPAAAAAAALLAANDEIIDEGPSRSEKLNSLSLAKLRPRNASSAHPGAPLPAPSLHLILFDEALLAALSALPPRVIGIGRAPALAPTSPYPLLPLRLPADPLPVPEDPTEVPSSDEASELVPVPGPAWVPAPDPDIDPRP